MIKRILEISSAARLRVRHRQLIVSREGEEDASVPIEDLGILILSNSAITHTQKVFTECLQNNVVIVLSDSRHLPCAAMMPLAGHSTHTKILAAQITATAPTKKRIWQAVVRAKIRHQAAVLRNVAPEEFKPLQAMVKLVQSGDSGNIEAQAARFYWPRLFGKSFRRNADADGANALLNYGYAIVRAATARAVVGAGLHPSLGIHHHNQYDSLCLADDLMEPLRPAVDRIVWEMARECPDERLELSPTVKKKLLGVLSMPCSMSDGQDPLMIAMHAYAASIRRCLSGEQDSPTIPGLE